MLAVSSDLQNLCKKPSVHTPVNSVFGGRPGGWLEVFGHQSTARFNERYMPQGNKMESDKARHLTSSDLCVCVGMHTHMYMHTHVNKMQ